MVISPKRYPLPPLRMGAPVLCQAIVVASVTYVLRCRPHRRYDKELARSTCLGFLRGRLTTKQPDLLVCLGNVAAQAFLGDSQAEIKNLRGKIAMHSGIATAFSYHPLAIRRRPNLQPLFEADWQLVADYYRKL